MAKPPEGQEHCEAIISTCTVAVSTTAQHHLFESELRSRVTKPSYEALGNHLEDTASRIRDHPHLA